MRKLLAAFFLLTIFTNTVKAQTTLVAGDIAFSGYTSNTVAGDEFSFVLLKAVTAGTVINFTDNGWLSTNVFRTGETTVTWTSTGAMAAGTEIKINGTTATLVGGGAGGTVTGTALSLSTLGDQVLAYQGSAATPTFISAIHMNVFVNGVDPFGLSTTASAWDGTANSVSGSALPPGLTTGVNAIWIGTQDVSASEFDNSYFTGCALNISTAALARTALNNQANWTSDVSSPPSFTLPTGCSYIVAVPAPTFTLNPTNSSVCLGSSTSFTVTATNATDYQWQVDNGGGFVDITNDVIYSGATTTVLTITAAPLSFNTYQYRCVASNGSGSTNSNAATFSVLALPASPTLLAKTPATATVADGTPVSATFTAGSGGTGCSDDYRYTTNGGATYLPYTPGSNISTTGLAASGGTVTIEGRRANCSSGCQGVYTALASWIVTPLPAGATTLNAGDVAFSSYASANDEFSIVLLRNIGPGTAINFTNNGWLSTNVFRTGEETITWTSNVAYGAGTEIKISGLTATLVTGGSAGIVTGTALSLNGTGDQILAYRGSAAAPTFITAIHMNVNSTLGGDAVSTTAAAWDGTANNVSSSSLPTGLTTGTNAIWIGTQDVVATEFDNARYGNCSNPATGGSISALRTALNNQLNWIKNNNTVTPGFTIPTGCNYLQQVAAPNITGQPANTAVCELSNTSFSVTATGATTYQWQVDPGSGFVNITDDAIYSGATTATLNITAAPFTINNTQYRCVVANGTGSTTSNGASLTLTPLAVAPTLLAKTPATATVADGTAVSATFNNGSGGAICIDDFRYSTDGGITYLPYTPGSNISTIGLAAGSGTVFIEGRRGGCSGILACDAAYRVLASWFVSPLPTAATTLNAGDIAFSSYSSNTDEFSFVLLRNIGAGTAINFTNNGWLSTNVFRTGEETITWTAPTGGMAAGTEIKIAGLTATKSGAGAAGTVTGTALSLNATGDQILAYRGSAAAPTFIAAIHMNVLVNGVDPFGISTTAAAWDGAANSASASALPTGLTTGTNAIWIGTQGISGSEFDNAAYGNCAGFGTLGPIAGLRAALNNQTNWIKNNNVTPGFAIPTGCNYLSILAPSINVTGTPLAAFTACAGSVSTEQNFTVSGSALTSNIIITAPAGFEISTTSGSGFATTVTLTQTGGSVPNTIIYVRMAASATGTPSGNITIASSGVTTINVAVAGTVNPLPATPTITAGGPTTFCAGGSVTLTSSSASGNLWSTGETTQSIIVTTSGTYTVTVTTAGCTSAPSAGTTVTVNPLPATPTITAGGPTTFCTGGSVVLTSSSATGNLWSTGATTASITVTTGGTYTVTVTSGGCTSAPSAGTTVTVDALPTTSNAGPDINACINPGTANMAANNPTVGTGAWSQIGGPVATSFGVNNPVTIVVGLNTAGTYTYVWTISNGTCAPSRDTMTITVNPNPANFTLVGGGTFCPGTTTLTGPVDPNYSYTWQRSLSGIANPNSYTNFGGTTSTQDVTSSGNYRLIVTNQFGCTTSDSTPVSMADFVFNGSLVAGDAQQTGRLNRFAVLSTCAAPKSCPLTFTTAGARYYDSYTVTNPRNVAVCATIGLRSDCGTSLFNVAYLGSYNPTQLCNNYLADPGSSFPGTGYMEVTIPANSSIVVVVHEVNPGTGCSSYQLTVDVPRETGVTVSPSTPICSATPVTLTAPVASSYSWNPGGNTTQSITVTPAVTTKYFVTLGYGNVGCNTIDSSEIVISPLPTVAFAGNDTAVCGLTINNLAANTAAVGTGTWSLVSGPGTVTFGNVNASNSSATVSVNGVYALRWTIATGAPCPNSTQDDVLVNFAATPSTADAGLDKTACVSPGNVSMTAAVPTAGSGVWTQVAGPTTASIISPNLPNTNINGLNTIGTYTFRWTVSNTPCASNFDEVNVVVNGNPTNFTITGGGTFCPSGTTLVGPVNPNYTYQWGKSYLAAPFAPVGTNQTLAVTSSGNYQLTVTNQFGCSTSATTIVNAADYVFTGSLTGTDAQQTGRLNRFANLSTCVAPKVCPGTFTTAGSRAYDSYTITNPRPVPVCAVIGLNSSCGTAVFSAAYSNSFDPINLCNNYLADPGSSPASSIFYEATIPANGTIVVVVHEVNPGQGCANYSLTVDVPRDSTPIVVNPSSVTCAGTATLTAPVANSYSWTPSGATTRSITTPPLFVNTQYKVLLGYGNNGCTRLDSTTVTVTSLPPTISCPANITANNTPGICGRAVTYSETSGGLPTPTITYTFTGATVASGAGNGSGSVFNVGVTTVTLTATNACGSVNCSFTVTIVDNQPPTVTTGTIGSCYPTVAAAQAAALAATSATDNCPGVLTETASTIGTCSAVVTVRTTDAAGNFTDVTYNTRIDNTAPIINCPAAITVCGQANIPAPNIALVSATDNCPGAVIITHQGDVVNGFSLTAPYTVTRTYRATDGCGNFADCTQTITVNPTATVNAVANQVVCNNTPTTAIAFSSPTTGGTIVYNWTNNTPSIGLAATGAGNIASFNATNTGTAPVTATITVTPAYTNAGITCTGTPITFTITVNPTATVNAVANQVVCNNTATTAVAFSSPTTGGTIVYNWTNNNTSIGLAATGTGNIASFNATNTGTAPVVATITVTPSYTNAGVTCTGTPRTFTITVNPTATVNAVANQVVCNNALTTAIAFSSPTTGGTIVYNWTNNTPSIGLAASGTGNIASFTAINTGTAPVVATVTVTPSYTNAGVTCTGTTRTFTITVNPTATVNAVANQVVCNNAPTTAVTFSSPTTGGTIVYNWTNNTPSIGLAATGSGNIASFNAINNGTAPVVATITVTPAYTNGAVTCTGTPTTFTITVNPTATVTAIANQGVCNGSPSTAITFTSPTTGGTIVYNWTNNTTSIGLAASGTGNIASFTAVNTGTAPVVATITVTPVYTNAGVTCTGTPRTFTITVNPTATVNAVANQTLCNNFPTTAVTFSSPTTGGTIVYNWTNNTPSIGLAASGSGNIPSFVATNTGANPVVATITVTPAYTNAGVTCTGTPITYTYTVNPTPVVTLAPFQPICKNAAPLTLTGGTPVTGTNGGVGVYFIDNTSTPQTVFNPALYTPGLHTITYQFTNQFGCVNSTSRTILVYPIHTVEITLAPNTGLAPGASATIAATVSPVDNYTYVWKKNNVVVPTAPTANSIVVLANDAGNYTVEVTAPTGCVVVSSSVFTPSLVIPQRLFIFPNPTNNGIFNVSYNNGGSNLTNRTLNVYDSRGARVFTKSYSINVPFGNMQVDISKYARGTYHVILTGSDGKQLGSASVIKL
ncbi:T9SS type A sorting domain-containing protein [Ferruginibacter yonginensis]